MIIGIPRAMLYHRYRVLWETLFEELGHRVVLSPKTDKSILSTGSRYGIDEACLSSKLLWGHIDALIGKSDVIFVPRIANFGKDGTLCTRFEALYDMARNLFRGRARFITCNVDIQQGHSEADAYIGLGISLGATRQAAKAAYKKAAAAYRAHLASEHRQVCRELMGEGLKVFIAGHSYNVYDEYIGRNVTGTLRSLDAVPILCDRIHPAKALAHYTDIMKDVPWTVNRELVGALSLCRPHIDGIILLTAFPCGPDSMVNEMIIRRIKELPILNLLLDSQDGNAGVDTRLESFVDIMRFRKEAGND